MLSAQSYQFEANAALILAYVTESDKVSIMLDSNGTIDLADDEMQATISIEMEASERSKAEFQDMPAFMLQDVLFSQDMSIGLDLYQLDGEMYINAELPMLGMMSMWLKTAAIEMDVSKIDHADLQTQLLEAAEFSLAGKEKVGTVDCYLLELTPDLPKLLQTAMAQAEAAGTETPEMPTAEELPDLKSFSAKLWVAQDTFHIMKAEMSIVMAAPTGTDPVDIVGAADAEITADITFSSYNQPVTIELPAEAEDAIDISELLGQFGFDESFGASETETQMTELANVQAAVTAMMVDNELWLLPNPVTVPTDDMTAFPDTSTIAGGDKVTDPDGNAYVDGVDPLGDKDGFILWGHDMVADNDQSSTANYVSSWLTEYWYTVDESGTVTQHLTPPW